MKARLNVVSSEKEQLEVFFHKEPEEDVSRPKVQVESLTRDLRERNESYGPPKQTWKLRRKSCANIRCERQISHTLKQTSRETLAKQSAFGGLS